MAAEEPGDDSSSTATTVRAMSDPAARAVVRPRWWVHLGLIITFVVALVPLLLFGVSARIALHVAIACFFLALVIVHLGQRRHTLARLAQQLVAWGSQVSRRGLAVSDGVLAFLVLNVLASGIWDFASERNNRIPLPGLRHFVGWHTLSSVVLLCYLVAHVVRRRKRLRRSLIR